MPLPQPAADAYPDAPRGEDADSLVGPDGPVDVPDPYRALEDPASPVTVHWSAAQDALARTWLDGLPGRTALTGRLTELLDTGSVSPPVWRGDRAFWLRRDAGMQHEVLLTAGADGVERVLLDPGAMDPDGLTTLDMWEPDREGRRVAYQLSSGGDEEASLRVLDVMTGEVVDGPVDRTRYSPVAWLPGGEAFYYVRREAPESVPTGEDQLHRRVRLRRLGSDPVTDPVVHGAGLDRTNYYGVDVSDDGRWLVVSAAAGTAPRDDVWLADLTTGPVERPALKEVQVGVDARLDAHVARDGRLWLRTDRGAPRGRLCAADPAEPSYDSWREVVAERPDGVLAGVVPVDGPDGPLLVVAHTVHAVAEVAVHDRVDGRRLGPLPLPPLGALTGLSARDTGGPEAWLGWTSHTDPPHVLHWDARRPDELLRWGSDPGGPADPPQVVVVRETYRSADGTEVGLFVLSPSGRPDRPRPTVLYGYGGFDIALEPSFSASATAWVEAGGVYAIANLRGGSEEGQDWHRGGMREHKQRVFDDIEAAGEHLLARGWAAPGGLGVSGGSNGGLLVGATVTRRPDLWTAAVCSAPLLDMVRYEQFGLGVTWNDEYGSAAVPVELGWLLGYSPYHAVREGVSYPAVLFTVFDADTRVDPMHARKMCAALQQATTAPPADAPVLLRRERDVGHGARSVARTVGLAVDTLAFLADRLGLELTGEPVPGARG